MPWCLALTAAEAADGRLFPSADALARAVASALRALPAGANTAAASRLATVAWRALAPPREHSETATSRSWRTASGDGWEGDDGDDDDAFDDASLPRSSGSRPPTPSPAPESAAAELDAASSCVHACGLLDGLGVSLSVADAASLGSDGVLDAARAALAALAPIDDQPAAPDAAFTDAAADLEAVRCALAPELDAGAVAADAAAAALAGARWRAGRALLAALPSDRAEAVALACARTHLAAAHSLDDHAVAAAQQCLALAGDGASVTADRAALAALRRVADFGVDVSPASCFGAADRMDAVVAVIEGWPGAPRAPDAVLDLASRLGLAGRDGDVLLALADAALDTRDGDAAADLVDRLARMPHPPAWRVAAVLAPATPDDARRAALTAFALAHATEGDDLLAVLHAWDEATGRLVSAGEAELTARLAAAVDPSTPPRCAPAPHAPSPDGVPLPSCGDASTALECVLALGEAGGDAVATVAASLPPASAATAVVSLVGVTVAALGVLAEGEDDVVAATTTRLATPPMALWDEAVARAARPPPLAPAASASLRAGAAAVDAVSACADARALAVAAPGVDAAAFAAGGDYRDAALVEAARSAAAAPPTPARRARLGALMAAARRHGADEWVVASAYAARVIALLGEDGSSLSVAASGADSGSATPSLPAAAPRAALAELRSLRRKCAARPTEWRDLLVGEPWRSLAPAAPAQLALWLSAAEDAARGTDAEAAAAALAATRKATSSVARVAPRLDGRLLARGTVAAAFGDESLAGACGVDSAAPPGAVVDAVTAAAVFDAADVATVADVAAALEGLPGGVPPGLAHVARVAAAVKAVSQTTPLSDASYDAAVAALAGAPPTAIAELAAFVLHGVTPPSLAGSGCAVDAPASVPPRVRARAAADGEAALRSVLAAGNAPASAAAEAGAMAAVAAAQRAVCALRDGAARLTESEATVVERVLASSPSVDAAAPAALAALATAAVPLHRLTCAARALGAADADAAAAAALTAATDTALADAAACHNDGGEAALAGIAAALMPAAPGAEAALSNARAALWSALCDAAARPAPGTAPLALLAALASPSPPWRKWVSPPGAASPASVRLAADTAAALAAAGRAAPAVGPADVASASAAAAAFGRALAAVGDTPAGRSALADVLTRVWGGGAVFGEGEALTSTRPGPPPTLAPSLAALLRACLAAGDGASALALADGGARVPDGAADELAGAGAEVDAALGAALAALLAPADSPPAAVAAAAAAAAAAVGDAAIGTPSPLYAAALDAAVLARGAWVAHTVSTGRGALAAAAAAVAAPLAPPPGTPIQPCSASSLAPSIVSALASFGEPEAAAAVAAAHSGLHPALVAADGGCALLGAYLAAHASPIGWGAPADEDGGIPLAATQETVWRALPFAARAALAALGVELGE